MNILILLVCIIVITNLNPLNLLYILISAFSTYLAALIKKHKKLIFILTIVLNVGILVFFKLLGYNNFFNLLPNNIFIPLGISYYTFQSLGYLIDVYKGKYKPEKKLFNYLLFVLYLPYLFIGPINRYDKLKETLYKKRKITCNNIFNGLIRITWGLFKKFVIAGRITIIISTITTNNYQGSFVLLAVLLYSFLLYADFSGGIDVVLGISHMLGITLEENFDSPYLALNLKEFWRRWHISLSSWFRDYLYIPLGGSRCSKLRAKLNVIITFIVSGLWHGINYFFWGLFHGVIVAFQNKPNENHKIIKIIANFLVISLLWIFFIYPTSLEAFQKLLTIFYTFNYKELFTNLLNLGLDFWNLIVLVITLIILIIVDINHKKLKNYLYNSKLEYKLIFLSVIILVILLFGIYGLGFNVNDFIYSKF